MGHILGRLIFFFTYRVKLICGPIMKLHIRKEVFACSDILFWSFPVRVNSHRWPFTEASVIACPKVCLRDDFTLPMSLTSHIPSPSQQQNYYLNLLWKYVIGIALWTSTCISCFREPISHMRHCLRSAWQLLGRTQMLF